MPVATQLELAIRSLGESEHAISGLKQRTKRAEEHADKMEKALNKAQTELLRRDREMAELRLEISAAQRHSFLESPDSRGETGDRSGGASLKVAQETVEQLKVRVWMVSKCQLSVLLPEGQRAIKRQLYSKPFILSVLMVRTSAY